MKKLFTISFVLNILFAAVIAWGAYTYVFLPTKTESQPQIYVKSANVNKTWNIENQNLYLNMLTAEKTNRIVSNGKRYTAKSGKAFFVLNLNISNIGKTNQVIAPKDAPSVWVSQDKALTPYFPLSEIGINPGQVLSSSLVYLVDESVNVYTISVMDSTGKADTLTITYK